MAELKEGILGGVSGKIGNLVGVKWRGRDLLRIKSNRPPRKASPLQQLQQDKLRLVSSFVSKMRNVVTLYYPEAIVNNKKITGREQLISLLMKQGLEVIDQVPHLVIERVLLAIGTLPAATVEVLQQQDNNSLLITWDSALVNILAHNEDELTLVLYDDVCDASTIYLNIGKRQEGQCQIQLPSTWENKRIHLWSIWVSTANKRNSSSQYHLLMREA